MRKLILLALALVLVVASPAGAGTYPTVQAKIYAGLTGTPTVVVATGGSALDTTKAEAFAALTTAERTAEYVQEIVVINVDTTGYVCLAFPAAAATCSSVTFSCLGASSGAVVPPGAMRAFPVAGTQKVCAVANEASVDVVFERSVSYAPK